jgi:hypothetical protein
MPYKAFHWQASDVHIFQKLSRMGGRAVLTLAQSTRNESVKVAGLEFPKRTRERKFRKVIRDFVETASSSVIRHPGLIRPLQ